MAIVKSNLLSYKHFRSGAAWIILLVGTFFYYLGYFQIQRPCVWSDVVIKIGDVLVIGVILGYLSNAAQFLGIFKQDLQAIIYGKEFLKQRKDITPLWETVSLQMFKEKFPSIHKDFLRVLQSYFPRDEVSYYNDYETYTVIEWEDKTKGIIKVTDDVSFKLIADSENEFYYPLKSWLHVGSNDYTNYIEDFTINGNKPDLGECIETRDGEDICHEHKIKVAGYNCNTDA